VPHDLVLEAVNGAHRLLLKATGGRVGYDARTQREIPLVVLEPAA
jgi:hypothetical protein